MPKVFVHGNPETSALWRVLFGELRARGIDDLTALSPPGFGAPAPKGWEPTRDHYRDWLIEQLDGLGGDVDLVGHDWGAGHVYGVLAERPDLVRSWAADCAGLIHRDYVWHDLAQAWQTPGAGEAAVAAMFGVTAQERAAGLTAVGIPEDIANDIAAEQNEETGRCVLALYRSAAQPAMRELGEQLQSAARRPGLVIVATEDPYAGTRDMAMEVANFLGANTKILEGLGHWWMFDGAKTAADALAAHWADL